MDITLAYIDCAIHIEEALKCNNPLSLCGDYDHRNGTIIDRL